MKQLLFLCLFMTVAACGGLPKRSDMCKYYGNCESEKTAQCSMWGNCGEEKKEDNGCTIWGCPNDTKKPDNGCNIYGCPDDKKTNSLGW